MLVKGTDSPFVSSLKWMSDLGRAFFSLEVCAVSSGNFSALPTVLLSR